ncbi:MAG TPA: GMP synthase [Chitinophagales bacterium]|nr:GMP synthase [Chitinophagales bacterium]HMU68698.1 GMP synthase [Chitinophagales bacterium]HMZ89072.1 GMP synthase [Chitinophagales bacterium]HNA57316.1 GMP synthase [Chitinophagales bacterium]HNE46829.1 GMP synthase [Chitinophagales bacterium]
MSRERKIKLAILDMYDNAPNEGMRCLKAMVQAVGDKIDWEVFEVRNKDEVPDKNFDIYISSGGPGSPFDGEGKTWEPKFFNLVDQITAHNANGHSRKKYMFAICHSFQLLSRHFELGEVCKRKGTAFGVFPIHKTEHSKRDRYFRNLPDPYYVVDSRDWQLIEPDFAKMTALGASIMAMEKKREHVPLPRAVMAIRLSDEMYMTQFHPEADAEGMLRLFAKPEKRETIRNSHGDWKLEEMVRFLSDQDKIPLTHKEVIPNFLRSSIGALTMSDT